MKNYIAFMAVLCSFLWLSIMTASQMETLTTPHARFIFLWSFIIAISAGVVGLCFLFTHVQQKSGC